METLIDALANKIELSDSHTERMNAVFCLSLITFSSEGALEKLLEHADAIRERLQESPELREYMNDHLMAKLTLQPPGKAELRRAIVDDLRLRLYGNDLEYAEKGLLSRQPPKKVGGASKKASSLESPPAHQGNSASSAAKKKRARDEITRREEEEAVRK
jgi:hypothetical protein